jgi:hypothetical protein
VKRFALILLSARALDWFDERGNEIGVSNCLALFKRYTAGFNIAESTKFILMCNAGVIPLALRSFGPNLILQRKP